MFLSEGSAMSEVAGHLFLRIEQVQLKLVGNAMGNHDSHYDIYVLDVWRAWRKYVMCTCWVS